MSQRPFISGINCICRCPPAVNYFPERLVAGFALQPPQNTSLHKTHCIVCWGGAEVSSTRRQAPQVNLRWCLWVGAWNVLSLRDGDGPGISLGDGQTETPGVPVESGHSDMLWHMLPMYFERHEEICGRERNMVGYTG